MDGAVIWSEAVGTGQEAALQLWASVGIAAPFEAVRATGAQIAWRADGEHASALLDQFAYVVGDGGDSAQWPPQSRDSRTNFWADRYGGVGVGAHGGSGRSGTRSGIQVKGIGRTPLVARCELADQDRWHHTGTLGLAEAIREVIWTEICTRVLPYGAVRARAIIVCPESVRSTDTGKNGERREPRALLLRDAVWRPGHFLRNVHFGASRDFATWESDYGEGEPWVRRHASLRIEAGESVAVAGPSGAGKTTLLKVLLGILEPGEGEVLYGGVPVRQLGLANARRRIGTVMQEDALLTGSLADNIAFFDVQPDKARIEACARLAQLHVDIVRMPMGYHTLVGDLGSGLSGGQKQRLLLARALYRRPGVLALDEATSHLDLANERAVTQALAQMRLTRLVIAHRPETIAGAQRVVQIKGGAVIDVMRALAPAPPSHAPSGSPGSQAPPNGSIAAT